MNVFKKITVIIAGIMLAGCGQVVQDMQDVPVISQQSETETNTEQSTIYTTTSSGKTILSTTNTTEKTVNSSLIYTTNSSVTTGSNVPETKHTTTNYVVENQDSDDDSYIIPTSTAKANIVSSAIKTTIPKTSSKTTTSKTTNKSTTTKTTTKITTTTKVTTTTTTVTTTTTTTTSKPDNPQDLLEQMTLEEKVYQMFMVKPEQLTGIYPTTASGETTKNAIELYPVGGIIYFADNLVSVSQTKSMLENVQQYAKDSSGVGIFTAVDEEGGTVARVAQKLGTTAFYNMQYYGELNDSGQGYDIGYTIGSDLKSIGFNLDFAPVADVNINEYNELGNRIFSSDPNVVANMATSVARGIQDAGVSATLKHFPGLGAEDGNTHEDSFVIIDRTVDQLRESEFVPFETGINAGVDFVMVSHQIVTGFEDNLPADLSYTAVTEYLRGELGFDGIAITDSQQMNTISNVYSSGKAAILSINAGIDIILMPENLQEAVNTVCNAVESGEISEDRIDESVTRILNKKYELGLF